MIDWTNPQYLPNEGVWLNDKRGQTYTIDKLPIFDIIARENRLIGGGEWQDR